MTTRHLGLACAASAILMTLMSFTTSMEIGDPSREQWGYPHSAGLFLVESLLLALAHLLSAGGFLGALRLGLAGDGRLGRGGLVLAVAGLAGLSAAELVSGTLGGEPNDSAAAMAVGAAFAVTSLVFAVGAIAGGSAVLRERRWTPVAAWSMVLTGVTILVLVTPANISGSLVFRQVALLAWSLLFLPIGLGILRASASRPASRRITV